MGELNIYQRINAVRKKVEYVQKDATVNGGGSYRAVTHDMVTAVLRDALIENGIVMMTDQRMAESIPAGNTKNGTPIIRYEAWYNSAPNGKKTEFKNKLNEMTKVGHAILVEINQGILQGDEFKVKENVSDLTDNCKRKLMNHLGQEKTQALIALTKKEAH